MKRTAFFQAVLILLLMGGSWLVLFLKLKSGSGIPEETPRDAEHRVMTAQESTGGSESADQNRPETSPEPVPPRWEEWLNYLEAMEDPQAMRQALDQLRELIRSMPPDEALAWILEFVRSGADMRTGLAFQPGKDGRLLGAGSLKSILLDLLHELDPALAADLAWQQLNDEGTRLLPDVYVIHLRNYAKNPSMQPEDTYSFLTGKMEILINHDPWLEDPGSAIAEAMDIIVFAEAVGFVPRLSSLMEEDRPQMLRHASALALERLVDRNPLEALDLLLEDLPASPHIANARAGYFARLDPDSPSASSLLEGYLKSPALERDEAVRFLESFPNLNTSLSYNLVSTNISNTSPGGYVDRLDNCLDQVRIWQSDPELKDLEYELNQAERRILSQLTGQPVP